MTEIPIIPAEDVDENRYLQYRYLDGNAKWVIVDDDRNVINKNPTGLDIEELTTSNREKIADLSQMPILKFPGMRKAKNGLYKIDGYVWECSSEFPNMFLLIVHDYDNPLLVDPEGACEDDGTVYLVRGIDTRDLCVLMSLTVYGYPNEDESTIIKHTYGERNENEYVFDGEWIDTQEKKVIIRGEEISIDKCIANEIDKLNNEHDIMTCFSCCGHQAYKGWISVLKESKDRMISLGYSPCEDNDQCFESKSKCNCKRYNLGIC